MSRTPFPITPSDVIGLTVAEFGCDIDWSDLPSLTEACRRFDDDNRALVWLIRVQALKAWGSRAGIAQWLDSGGRTRRDACEVAATMALNDRWEFDTILFCDAVDRTSARRRRRAC